MKMEGLDGSADNQDAPKGAHVSSWAVLRQTRFFWTVYLCMLAASMLPILLVSYLPFVDLPPHIAELSVLARWNESGLQLQQFYQLDRWVHPYTPHRLLLLPIAYLGGARLAYHIFICGIFALSSLSGALLLARLKRSVWPALLLLPLTHSFSLHFGFATYAAGCAGLLFALYVWEGDSGSGWRGWVRLAGVGLLVGFLHLQAFIIWAVLLTTLTLVRWQRHGLRWTYPLRTLTTQAPMFVVLVVVRYVIGAIYATREGPMGPPLPTYWSPPISTRLFNLDRYAGVVWTGDTLLWLYIVAFATLIIAARIFAEKTSDGPAEDNARGIMAWLARPLYTHRYLFLASTLFAGAMILPENLRGQAYFASRLPGVMVMMIVIGLGAACYRSRWVIAAIVLTSGMPLAYHGSKLLAFQIEAESFDEVVARVPEGDRYRCQIDNRHSPLSRLRAYDHFCSFILVEKGGLNGFLFRGIGVNYRKGYGAPRFVLYGSQFQPTERFPLRSYGNQFRLFIVRSRHAQTAYDRPPVNRYFRRTWAKPPWIIYERIRPFPPEGKPY